LFYFYLFIFILCFAEGTVEAAAAAGVAVPPLPYVSPQDSDAQGFNVFRRILGSIEDPGMLNFIFRGFVRLLNNVHQSESTYLPYSITRVSIEQVIDYQFSAIQWLQFSIV
jgi:hypothetical protein